MWAMILNALWQALKWKIGSGLAARIYELATQMEDNHEDSGVRKQALWSKVRKDPEVREIISTKGRYLINFAIETAVARLRG